MWIYAGSSIQVEIKKLGIVNIKYTKVMKDNLVKLRGGRKYMFLMFIHKLIDVCILVYNALIGME